MKQASVTVSTQCPAVVTELYRVLPCSSSSAGLTMDGCLCLISITLSTAHYILDKIPLLPQIAVAFQL